MQSNIAINELKYSLFVPYIVFTIIFFILYTYSIKTNDKHLLSSGKIEKHIQEKIKNVKKEIPVIHKEMKKAEEKWEELTGEKIINN